MLPLLDVGEQICFDYQSTNKNKSFHYSPVCIESKIYVKPVLGLISLPIVTRL